MKLSLLRILSVSALLATVSLSIATSASAAVHKQVSMAHRIVGYYGDWDKYCDPGHCSPITNVQFGHISDFVYSFADETNDTCDLVDHVNDAAKDFPVIRQMKQKYPNLKVLLSVGGYSYAGAYPAAVATKAAIKTLVHNCMTLIHQTYPGVFDGIDIDWEYPSNAIQRTDFTNLITAFRSALGKSAPLTFAAGANPAVMKWINWKAVLPKLSWINLMAYDYHGPWGDPVTGFIAPLNDSKKDPMHNMGFWDTNSVNTIHKTYKVPTKDIVLGTAFYGRGYAGVSSTNHGLYQKYSGATTFGTSEPAAFDYRDLVANYINKNGYKEYGPDPSSMESWVYSKSKQVFISFDTPATMAAKSKYIDTQKLGGIIIWDIGYDTSSPKTSLTTALYNNLKPLVKK